MKNVDKEIDRVLAGLRDAEAPEGMERRILAAMQDNPSQRSAWRLMWLNGPSRLMRTRSWATALAGVAVILLGIHWTTSRAHRVEHDIAGTKQQQATPANPPSHEIHELPANPVLAMHETPPTPLGVKARTRKAGVAHESDSLAVQEMHAASLPAPPLPLTDQEKLLLRIAHKGDPVELAMLNPETRAKQEEEAKAQFQKFFQQPTRGDNK
jgi:hypothetical protein